MQFLLILMLGVAQSGVADDFSRTAPEFVQEGLIPAPAPAQGDGLQQLIPNQAAPLPHGDHALEDGALYPVEPDVFMPPSATAADPLQNFGPNQVSQFGSHHGRPDLHRGGPPAPFGMIPGQPSQGCMPGAGGSFGCRGNSQLFAGDSFSSGPSCQTCQTCPSSCEPSICYQGCYPGCFSCCPLFGCWHLCNHCDPCTHKRLQAKYCYTPGDMYPESFYFPVNHGNYYFRPYTWSHVGMQQQIAARWGADPRAPYQSQLFSYLYDQMGIPLPTPDSDSEDDRIPMRDRKPSDYFTTVP